MSAGGCWQSRGNDYKSLRQIVPLTSVFPLRGRTTNSQTGLSQVVIKAPDSKFSWLINVHVSVIL